MSNKLKELLERAELWSEDEVAELDEVAREIEIRRTGIYHLSSEERAAIEKSLKSPLVSEKDMEVFWKRYGVK